MSRSDEMLGIIDELYAGALDPERLTKSLGRVVRLTSASGGQLYTHYHGENKMRFAVFFEIDPVTYQAIDDESVKVVTRSALQVPLGRVQATAETWPIEQMKKSTFYNEVLQNLDIMHGAAGLAVRTREYYGVVSMSRSERCGQFSLDERRILQTLLPHFRNVLQINNAMASVTSMRDSFAAALDSLPDGVVLIDKRGKIVCLNRTAEHILSSNDGLSIKAGQLATEIIDEERRLHRLIGQAASGRITKSLQRGGTCAISRPSGSTPWLLFAAPCGDFQLAASSSSRAACTLLIRDTSRRYTGDWEKLRQVFGLTMQEAKVALAVSNGHGLSDAARALGLSVLTVRNHLQRVFVKTGVNRQAELAGLIAAFLS